MDLNDAHEKIAALRGETMAMHAMLFAILEALPMEQLDAVEKYFEEQLELARVALLNSARADEAVSEPFERAALELSSKVHRLQTGLG